MKLSEWANSKGLSYRGAYEMFHRGQLPNAYQLPSGTIIVDEEKLSKVEYNVIYSRVSSPTKKEDLLRQVERLRLFCLSKGIIIHKEYKEIASGLNDNRKELTKILENNEITNVIIEHKDRLTRFGFNYLKLLLKNKGCNIIIINESKDDETDLMTDFVSIITSMTARLYGLRRSKMKVFNLIENLKNE